MPAQPLNNAVGELAADHLVGSGTLVLKEGQGAIFGTPSAGSPIRVTVARRPTLVSGRVVATTTSTIYLCTSRSGDTLSGLTAVEDTSDRKYYKGDPVAVLITAGTLSDIAAAQGTLVAANNLSDLASAATARANLGLGTAATRAATDFLTPESSLDPANLAAGTAGISVTGNAATAATAAALSGSIATSQVTGLDAALLLKAPLDSPPLAGTPTAPTATAGTNTTQIATTAFVAAGLALKANAASPTFTGTVTAPTVQVNTELRFGGSTASFPKLVRNANDLQLFLADGSARADWAAANGDFAGTLTASGMIQSTAGGGQFAGQVTTTGGSAGIQLYQRSTNTPGWTQYCPSAGEYRWFSNLDGGDRLGLGQTGIFTWYYETSTASNQPRARITPAWADSAHATRKGRLTLAACDFSGTDREGFRVESDGTQAEIGFFGGPAAAKQAAIPDTSGATLAQLEAEVNKLKQLIRNFNLMS